MISCYNGQLIEKQDIVLPIDDRGFQYADGIFETLVVRGSKIFFIEDHWERLNRGCDVLKLNLPVYFKLDYLVQVIRELLSVNNLTDARIKLIVWRCNGGLYEPTSIESNFVITLQPHVYKGINKKSVVKISRTVQLVFTPFSQLKTLNALTYIVASLEKRSLDCDDVLLTNQNLVGELTAASVFFIKDKEIFTPPIATGIIPGIMRKNVITNAGKLGYVINELPINIKNLGNFEGCFGTNVTGFTIIEQIEDIKFSYSATNEVINKFIKHFEL